MYTYRQILVVVGNFQHKIINFYQLTEYIGISKKTYFILKVKEISKLLQVEIFKERLRT